MPTPFPTPSKDGMPLGGGRGQWPATPRLPCTQALLRAHRFCVCVAVQEWNALQLACEDRNVQEVRRLLQQGADPLEAHSTGLTAVDVAAQTWTKEVSPCSVL